MNIVSIILVLCSLLEKYVVHSQGSFRTSFRELVIPLRAAQDFLITPRDGLEIFGGFPFDSDPSSPLRMNVHLTSDYHRERIITCLRRGIMRTSSICRHHRRCLLFPRSPRCSPPISSRRRSRGGWDSSTSRRPLRERPGSNGRDIGILPPANTPVCNISCPRETFLYGGECQAGASLCNPSCPDGFECHHGHCDRAPCSQPCSGGLRCRNRRCVDIVQCNPPCCSGQVCRLGRCEVETSRPSQGQCDPACPPGFICHNGHCDREQTCPEPCPPGYECHLGHCHREGFTDHSHCDPPCGQNEECHDGHCERIHTDNRHGGVRFTEPSGPGNVEPRCNPPCAMSHECHAGRCEPIGGGHGHGSLDHAHDHDHHHNEPVPPVSSCNPPCSPETEVCNNEVCDPVIPSLVDVIGNMPDSPGSTGGASGTSGARGTNTAGGAGSTSLPGQFAFPQINTNGFPFGTQGVFPNTPRLPVNAFPNGMIPGSPGLPRAAFPNGISSVNGISGSPGLTRNAFPNGISSVTGLQSTGQRTLIPNGQPQLVGIAPIGQSSNQIPSPDSWFSRPWSDESRLLSTQQGG